MSERVEVRPLLDGDLGRCGELLAERHRADLERLPYLEPSLEDPAGATEAVRGVFGQPFAAGVVATRGTRIVGFCVGTRLDFSVRDFAAQFLPLRSAVIPALGHAVEKDADAIDISRRLYAALAAGWVRDGILVHRIELTAGDRAGEEAWVALGFGRVMTAATRRTSLPVAGSRRAGLRVDRATPEDQEAVGRLSRELVAHHRQAPMFWPPLMEAGPVVDGFLASALAGDTPTFLAWEGNEAVGMQLFLLPGFTPPTIRTDQRLYLFEGVVSASARGGGVGTALLAESMAWASEHGHELCTLHWAAGNYVGAPFWLRHGFVPVGHTMERRVDDRALWGRPEPGHTT